MIILSDAKKQREPKRSRKVKHRETIILPILIFSFQVLSDDSTSYMIILPINLIKGIETPSLDFINS